MKSKEISIKIISGIQLPVIYTKSFFRYLKSFYRRGRYGWDYSDTYSIDEYFLKTMSQMLRYLATKDGCPSEFYNEKTQDCEKWKEFLIKMAEDFENYLNYDLEGNFDYSSKKYKKLKYKRDRGLRNFVKYFECLWW